MPRRRFPGGSVGSFAIVHGQYRDFMTEEEAIQKATELSAKEGMRMYVFKYVNHVDPKETDA